MTDKGLSTVRFFIRAAIGVVIVAEVVLAVGVLLQVLGANPEAGFAEWAYRNQDRLMGPFEDLFDDKRIGDSDGVIDVSGLFAVAVYGLAFIPLGAALGAVRRARLRNVERKDRAIEEARQARMFGGEPAQPPAEHTTIGRRLSTMFDRRRGPAAPEPSLEADE